jgi:periplasmic divalent cation tolerance protein
VSGAALIWCPFANEAEAEFAASRLLDEGLIACANIMPSMRSLYSWNGERGEARECGAMFKTSDALLARATERLEAIHPYETPAVVGWRADSCGAATVQWLASLQGGAA